MTSTRRRWLAAGAGGGAACLLAALALAPPALADDDGLAGSELYLNPYSTTLEAGQALDGQAQADAQLLGSIPSAEWFTSGTPDEVQAEVAAYVDGAESVGELPMVVAYNLPFRDCAQYSEGGAADTAEYEAWIDGVAAGIGDREAVVIVEPDGLGIIPWYTNLDGTLEWCQPAELDPATAADERFTQMNYAVDVFAALPAASAYLDATHSGWLNVGDASNRLIDAGVGNAAGFFLNASNYQFTANLEAYGRWISSCIALVTEVGQGFGECGNQYWNGGPATGWAGTAMSNFGEWSADDPDPALNTTGVDSRYEASLGGVEPTTRFVIDTSRNGQGPWDASGTGYSDPEDWCNPPDRGLGQLPSTDTGVDLLDAYLWIKVPGESDGKCFRGTGGPLDPERGREDPAAGQWFVEQARELIAFAEPRVEPLACEVDWRTNGNGQSFSAAIRISGDGDDLSFVFAGDQRVTGAAGATAGQDGAVVTLVDAAGAPGQGNAPDAIVKATGGATDPWLTWLDGNACVTR